MGYTHYWERPRELDAGRFDRFHRDVGQLLDCLPNHTTSGGGYYADSEASVRGADGTGEPTVSGMEVTFNGDSATCGEDRLGLSHEAFHLPRLFAPRAWQQPDVHCRCFDFCKTARKPYDLAVVAALISLQHYFPEVIVNSDGDTSEWAAGLTLCRRVLGYGKLPPSIAAKKHDACTATMQKLIDDRVTPKA